MTLKENEDEIIIELLKYGQKIGICSDELVSLIEVIDEFYSLELNTENLFENACLTFPKSTIKTV